MGAKIQLQRIFLLRACLVAWVLTLSWRCNAENSPAPPPKGVLPPETQALLDQIGKWKGEPQEAKLEGPYEDPRQQEIPFGRVSFYLAPWRAYMDTWPARQYLDCLGINLKTPLPALKGTAKVLSEAGFCSARVEIGWGQPRLLRPSANLARARIPANSPNPKRGGSSTIDSPELQCGRPGPFGGDCRAFVATGSAGSPGDRGRPA